MNEFLIPNNTDLRTALKKLNGLPSRSTLYVISKDFKLLGSITDGDIRRSLINNNELLSVTDVMNNSPTYLSESSIEISEIINYREKGYSSIPILNSNHQLVRLIDFRKLKSIVPVEVLLMAGGLGSRLRPLTERVPKPLIKLNNKAIIDHNIDRLRSFGISKFHISVKYLGELIETHFKQKSIVNTSFKIVWEENSLGTIGAAALIEEIQTEYLLVSNSDILTKLNYESFYLDCIAKNADMSIIGVPYKVNIPYGVLVEKDNQLVEIQEKPTKTYFSNGGIYLIRKEILNLIPKDEFFNATDLIQTLIEKGKKVITYRTNDFWLDIGKPKDLEYAKEIIKDFDQ